MPPSCLAPTTGFVEDQKLRLAEQRPGKRNALALAARQPGASLAHYGLQAVWQAIHERVSIRRLQCLPHHRFGGIWDGKAKVCRYGARG